MPEVAGNYRVKGALTVGRPCVLDNEATRNSFLATVAMGVSYARACRYVGISEAAFDDYRRRSPEFCLALDKAEIGAEIWHLSNWQKAATGQQVTVVDNRTGEVQICDPDWRASAEFLARRFPAEWGRVDRHEITGKDGGPVRIEARQALERLTDEEIEQYEALNRKAALDDASSGEPEPDRSGVAADAVRS